MGSLLSSINGEEEDSALKQFVLKRRMASDAPTDTESVEEEMEHIQFSDIRKTEYLEDKQSILHLIN